MNRCIKMEKEKVETQATGALLERRLYLKKKKN